MKGKFSFDQYVGRHQQGHNELMFLEEPVAETKKVTNFLAGICDPKLETAIQSPNSSVRWQSMSLPN